jgi:hypothetical protein
MAGILCRGEDKYFSDIETTIVFLIPDLAEATGISKMIMLSLMIWSDEDKVTTTLERYTKHHIAGTIVVPSTPGEPLDAHSVPEGFALFYPEARGI